MFYKSQTYLSVGIEAEFGVDGAHGRAFWVESLEGGRVRLVEVVDKDEELSEAALLEHAHQAGAQGLGLVGRHLVDFVALEDVAALADLFIVTKNA